MAKRTINVKESLAAIKGGMNDSALTERYAFRILLFSNPR